jgi:hypothetical protein
MPCPTCGADDVTPLTLTRFEGLAGAAKVCEECHAVFLVADEARLPASLRRSQISGWEAVRAVLRESVDALLEHPVVRDHFVREDTETDVWRRDALDAMERAVAALVPILRRLAD